MNQPKQPKQKKSPRHDRVARQMANNVRSVRQLMGLTQEDLARKLGHTTAWIGAIEQARNMITIPDLIELMALSGQPPEYFLQSTGHRVPSALRPQSLGDWLRLYPENKELAEAHYNLDKFANRN